MSSLKLAASLVVMALLCLAVASACGGGEGSPATGATATPSPLVTPTPTASVASPSPIASPVVLAGITLYPGDAWVHQGRSLCASFAMEAPYLGPVVFSVRDEELPVLTFPEGYKLLDVRMCKHGITTVGYIFDDAFVILADGPHEWPINAPPEQLSAGTIAGRPAVFVAPTVPGQSMDATIIVAEDFGITAVGRMKSLEEARSIAETINREDIHIPQGKDTFTGTLNGIRFYDNLHADNRKDGCLWGNYGIEDPEADGVEIPPATPLDVFPSHLPEGYSLFAKRGTTCGGTIDLVEANFSRAPTIVDLGILRLSGEPAWYSVYSEDWLTSGNIAGKPAVLIAPPVWAGETDAPIEVVVKEDFGLTVVMGNLPLDEAKRVAEGLNR